VSARGLSRRGFLYGAGAAGTGLVLAACTSGANDQNGQTTGSAPGFPVTVEGKLGSTTVTAPPKRVVAAGYLRDTDIALALGADLLLSSRHTVFAHGMASWSQPAAPTEVVYGDTIPMEKIASLGPDLILAIDDQQLETDHPRLTQIAPTLGYRNGINKDTWQDMLQRAGDVLGKRPLADDLIKQVQQKIDGTKAQHPEFAGRTFTFGPVSAPDSIYTISSTTDASATFFSQLGLQLSPKVTTLPQSSTPNRAAISPERLDLIDADVLILTFTNDGVRRQFEARPLFQELSAVKRGSYIALDMPTAIALAFPSVRSIPYGLDVVTPKLTAAVHNGASA